MPSALVRNELSADTASVNAFAKFLPTIAATPPTISCVSPSALFIAVTAPPKVFLAAAAEPPNCISSSFNISLCAPTVSPDSCMVFIMSFCCCVNDTPARDKAVTPFVGSLRAFPSCKALCFKSWPRAALISTMACVVCGNTSFPIFVNVNKRFCPDSIASSPYEVKD